MGANLHKNRLFRLLFASWLKQAVDKSPGKGKIPVPASLIPRESKELVK